VLNLHLFIHLSSKLSDMSLRYGIIKTGISFDSDNVTSRNCIKQSQSLSMDSSIHEAIANLSSWNGLQCWAYRRDIAVAWQSYGLLLNPGPSCSQHLYCLNMSFQSKTLQSLWDMHNFSCSFCHFLSQSVLFYLHIVGVEYYCCT